MLDGHGTSPSDRVLNVVQRLLTERSINRAVQAEDDLREAGLTSLDMVNLVLAVEAEFDINIAENDITPANFRSIAAISRVVGALLNNA